MYRIISSIIILYINFSLILFSQATKLTPSILFVHGLGGNETTWKKTINALEPVKFLYVSNYRITKEINYQIIEERKANNLFLNNPSLYRVFTVTFEDNQNLSFQDQGIRLRKVVDDIHSITRGQEVILFSHSMGGLASRACIMQNPADIIGLVTAGTPHGGSFLAYSPAFKNELGKISNKLSYLIEVAANTQDLSLSSRAISMLAPDSPEMIKMYSQVFPLNIPLVNVISRWDPGTNITQIGIKKMLDTFTAWMTIYKSTKSVPIDMMSQSIQLDFSDGVVSVPSQYIKSGVDNATDLWPELFFTDKFHTDIPDDTKCMKEALDKIIELSTKDRSTSSSAKKSTICFIIDSSGSMKSSDPQDIRKSAVEQIVDLLTGNENFFLIDFDGESKWLNPDNWKIWNPDMLKSAIRKIDSDGMTNVGLGLSTLKQTLQVNLADFRNTAVVLLSDGKGNYNNEADWFAQNGIKIYTISYKDEADANMLNRIALSTGGVYIQANNESDVVAAFMQFSNDLKGLDKFMSFDGNFNGAATINIPPFFVDPGTKDFSVVASSSGIPKLPQLISPSGMIYSASGISYQKETRQNSPFSIFAYPNELRSETHGPFSGFESDISNLSTNMISSPEWIIGNGYVIFKMTNPEPGEWKAILNSDGLVPNNDSFLFEAIGEGGKNIELKESKGAGTYKFNLSESDPGLQWDKSRANIQLETPLGDKIDISSNYKNGSFFFYPSGGIGNYQVDAAIWVSDNQNNTYQRQFLRSELVGEILPGYIAPIKETIGTYLITEQGTLTGNRAGIKCFIYAPGGGSSSPKALGFVTHVNDRECTITVTSVLKGSIEKGDIVELDLIQWRNDK